MRISPIVLKLRLAETRFEDKVGGTAELAVAERQVFDEEAFVYQVAEQSEPNDSENIVIQRVTEVFAVVVVLKNDNSDKDKLGLTAYDSLFDVRAELFSALIGWEMPDAESKVSYVGGRVLKVTRAYLMYQFEFSVNFRLCEADQDVSGMDEFNQVWAEYILAPDEDNLPVSGGNPLLPREDDAVVDMVQSVERE